MVRLSAQAPKIEDGTGSYRMQSSLPIRANQTLCDEIAGYINTVQQVERWRVKCRAAGIIRWTSICLEQNHSDAGFCQKESSAKAPRPATDNNYVRFLHGPSVARC